MTNGTYSPAEVAELLGGDPQTYRIMARDGVLKFPHFYLGKHLRFPKQPIDEMARLCGKHDYAITGEYPCEFKEEHNK